METVLIVEDDEKIARVIELELTYEGYDVHIAYTGKEALKLYHEHEIDAVLLDVMIPELNGLEVLRRIRNEDAHVVIIMLTARDAVMDKVSGLDSGANDYITKPFEIEELLARIRAHLKQQQLNQPEPDETLKFRNIELHPQSREVYLNQTLVELTQKEYNLLYYFMSNKNIALERAQILEYVWGYDFIGDTDIVDVYVRYLRKKLDTTDTSIISSVRGVGYMMRDES
ncbi:response regulator transcription factor [Staphylococcus sp. IVB6181]|uniref:response regulator transcription factor n=1 Tax=Staphylococcus sp. IVB6181 TaxID=2929481 RepID=UPI0021D28B83|nr:response regulator transcription factor [Staphylococcus sp. IVB6181]UXV34088.1 response regulator transcription factor [Staphylococcus sp. IVB6181]